MYFNPTMETIATRRTEKTSIRTPCQNVKNVYDHVPFYTKKMDELGVKPEESKESKTFRSFRSPSNRIYGTTTRSIYLRCR
jgi:phenylacetate-coenzyme A ligase PaaK-like adenylate-forming protein